jgi:hypothetical protein
MQIALELQGVGRDCDASLLLTRNWLTAFQSAIVNGILGVRKTGTSHIAETLPVMCDPPFIPFTPGFGQAVSGGLSLLQKAFFCKLLQDACDSLRGLTREAIDDVLGGEYWELEQ